MSDQETSQHPDGELCFNANCPGRPHGGGRAINPEPVSDPVEPKCICGPDYQDEECPMNGVGNHAPGPIEQEAAIRKAFDADLPEFDYSPRPNPSPGFIPGYRKEDAPEFNARPVEQDVDALLEYWEKLSALAIELHVGQAGGIITEGKRVHETPGVIRSQQATIKEKENLNEALALRQEELVAEAKHWNERSRELQEVIADEAVAHSEHEGNLRVIIDEERATIAERDATIERLQLDLGTCLSWHDHDGQVESPTPKG